MKMNFCILYLFNGYIDILVLFNNDMSSFWDGHLDDIIYLITRKMKKLRIFDCYCHVTLLHSHYFFSDAF